MARSPSILWLGAATMLAPLAVSVHVPVLPEIGLDLTGARQGADATVSVFLWVFALTMLGAGPLSDRLGRRPVLYAGLVVFGGGSLLGALAPTLSILLVARTLQGLGASALVVVPRAVVRDAFEDTTGPMSQLAALQSIAPAIAPLLGGLVGAAYGWRAAFVVLVLGALVLAALGRSLPETRAMQGGVRSQMPAAWRRLAVLTITGSAASAVYFALLPAAPEVLSAFGRGPRTLGVALLFVAGGFAIGSAVAPRLAAIRGRGAAIVWGSMAVGVGVAVVTFLPGALGIGLGLAVYSLANGVLFPLTIAEGLEGVPAYPGRAASIMGAVQLGLGALASSLVESGISFFAIASAAALLTVGSAFLLRLAPSPSRRPFGFESSS